MDICDKKNQIQDLLNDIYSEYNRMNESKLQSRCENDLEMRTMSSNIRSLETSTIEKDNRIKLMEKTIFDYEIIIEDLHSKLEIKAECENENNRHNMLRIQAKEITEKDREIDRLNGLLEFHKKEKARKSQGKEEKVKVIQEVVYGGLKSQPQSQSQSQSQSQPKSQSQSPTDSGQIDTILEKVSKKETSVNIKLKEVIESVDEETGEVNPNFIYPAPEPEPSPGGSIHSELENEISCDDIRLELAKSNSLVDKEQDKEQDKEPDKEQEQDKEPDKGLDKEPDKEPMKTLMRFKAKGIWYFAYKGDNPQDVYEYNEEKRVEKIIGKRTRMIDRKYKLELF